MKIAHITSVHPRYDIRIFVKECITLADVGFDVSLIVADGLGDEIKNGVAFYDVGARSDRRIARMSLTTASIYKLVLKLKPDVVHFHDPELLLIALLLKSKGYKVIYDVHEDLPRQVLSKRWIPPFLRAITSAIVEKFEDFSSLYFDGIVCATPKIHSRFNRSLAISICNYPIIKELMLSTAWGARSNDICYVGSISCNRGIVQIIGALSLVDTKLNLAGIWDDNSLKVDLQHSAGWLKVRDFGIIDRKGVADLLASSKIGIVTLLPTPSYMESLPIKMFEYMAAGIPVIASDFPLWRDIIEDANCGILVDPLDPKAIAFAINSLLADEQKMQNMGAAGQDMIISKYNWENEGKKLISLYNSLQFNA